MPSTRPEHAGSAPCVGGRREWVVGHLPWSGCGPCGSWTSPLFILQRRAQYRSATARRVIRSPSESSHDRPSTQHPSPLLDLISPRPRLGLKPTLGPVPHSSTRVLQRPPSLPRPRQGSEKIECPSNGRPSSVRLDSSEESGWRAVGVVVEHVRQLTG